MDPVYINIVNTFSTHGPDYTGSVTTALETAQTANYLIASLAQIEGGNDQMNTQLTSVFPTHGPKHMRPVTTAPETARIANYSTASLAQIENGNDYMNEYAPLNIGDVLPLDKHFD